MQIYDKQQVARIAYHYGKTEFGYSFSLNNWISCIRELLETFGMHSTIPVALEIADTCDNYNIHHVFSKKTPDEDDRYLPLYTRESIQFLYSVTAKPFGKPVDLTVYTLQERATLEKLLAHPVGYWLDRAYQNLAIDRRLFTEAALIAQV